MSIRVSVLKRSIRPRSRSLTRGWVTPRILAACICRRRRPRTMSWTWSIRMERIRRCSASSREKPRSRNTLPLDGTIFIFMAGYPSSHRSTTTPVDYLAQAGPRQIEVSPGSPSGLLLKRVEDIDTLGKAGDVNRPDAPDPCARESPWHQFPRSGAASNHPGRALVGPATAGSRLPVGPRPGTPSGQTWTIPTKGAASPRAGTIQVLESSVKGQFWTTSPNHALRPPAGGRCGVEVTRACARRG